MKIYFCFDIENKNEFSKRINNIEYNLALRTSAWDLV